MPAPVKVRFAPPDSIKAAVTFTVPELTLRLIACPLVPSLNARSPPTVSVCAPTLRVCVTLLVHTPATLPSVWSDPPEPSVSVMACALPKEMLFTATEEVMVG